MPNSVNNIKVNINNYAACPALVSSQPSQAETNAMNYLWFVTYQLNQEGSNPNDPINLQMLAKAIAGVAGITPASGDSASDAIWSELTGGSTPPAAGSPAALAAAYLANPQDPIAEKNFMNCADSLNNNNFGNTVNNWWGQEGMSSCGATISPGTLQQADVAALDAAIQAYNNASPPTTAQIQAIMAAVNKVEGELSSSSNLDPYSQMLSDLLNTPLNPSDPSSTLAKLAADTGPNAVDNFGLALNQYGNEMFSQIQTVINKEWLGG